MRHFFSLTPYLIGMKNLNIDYLLNNYYIDKSFILEIIENIHELKNVKKEYLIPAETTGDDLLMWNASIVSQPNLIWQKLYDHKVVILPSDKIKIKTISINPINNDNLIIDCESFRYLKMGYGSKRVSIEYSFLVSNEITKKLEELLENINSKTINEIISSMHMSIFNGSDIAFRLSNQEKTPEDYCFALISKIQEMDFNNVFFPYFNKYYQFFILTNIDYFLRTKNVFFLIRANSLNIKKNLLKLKFFWYYEKYFKKSIAFIASTSKRMLF